MHEWGDSGITAVLLAIVAAVLLSLGVVHKVRARGARYQEIRRLQSEAAEEARREEAEAHAEYTSMVANRNYCAVCSNPTATRCSRCKAVRYCSSTCQVQHWKQGHKQECRAPAAAVHSPASSSNGSRNFSDAFSSSSGSSGSGSRTLSEVSEVHSVEDAAEFSRAAPSLAGNGTLVRPRKILCPYDYFVTFFNWERLTVPPCGLINCGNSCFANVVLQCLTYTRPLTAFLLEGTHGEECRRSDWCFMCELQDHVWRVRQSSNPFSPIRILSRIRNIGNHLGYGRQEDAHEFMRFAIDSMQSICLDEAGGEKSVDPRSQETTFIHHIFGGHLQSQVKCMQCWHESNRYENMMDLAVEIQGCVETLEDALTQFTASELLDGENKYKCDRCNAYVNARKRLTMHEAPNVLTIALKRFQSGKFGKLNKRVTFPEVLDVSPYMSGKGDKPPLYRLYAVVVHVDMLNASFFGHYICYVKDSQGLWYKIDDSKVKEVDLEKVMAQRAYMLFYTRSFARPPPLTDGAILPYSVVGTPELGKVGSDRQGGLKVFPAPQYFRSNEMLAAGGAEGLHAMVDFNQMLADVKGGPETVLEHSVSNGEIATLQSSSWETKGIPSSSSNDDEISVEDSGCAASSSSLTQTSPYISSYTSNHGVWVPNQGFVCQVPDLSTVDGTEYAPWDQKSSLPRDFSEVSLQSCAMDVPCTAKIGKRRLEDGLSPLPTPKPLDTDQLPAWPAGSNGRSTPCPPVPHLSANPSNCSISDESHSSWTKYDSEGNLEPLTSVTFPMQQHRMSGDQLCHPAIGESSQELEGTEFTGTGEEEIAARAKRQHVEIDRTMDPPVIAQRDRISNETSQAVEDSSSSNLGLRDMDCDEPSRRPGSLTSGAILEPRLDPAGDDLSADGSKFTSSGQVRLESQVTAQSCHPLESDVVGSSLSPRKESGGVKDIEKSNCKEPGTTMQFLETSSIIPTGRTEILTSPPCIRVDLEKSGPGSVQNSSILEAREGASETEESSRSIQPLSPSCDGLQEKILEIAACYSGVTGQDTASPSMDRDGFLENVSVNHESEIDTGTKPGSVADTPAMTEKTGDSVQLANGPPLDVLNKSLIRKVPKSKSTAKPLFAPGFLNRVHTPVRHSKTKLNSVASSKTSSVEENGHVNQVEGQVHERVSDPPAVDLHLSSNGVSQAEDLRAISEVDQLCSPDEGSSHAAVNGDSLTTVGVVESSPCCESCNSGRLDKQLENGHETGNGLVPALHDNLLTTIDKSDHESPSTLGEASKLQAGVNGNGSSLNTPQLNIDDMHSVEPVSEPVAPLGRSANGRQKQGRNETCKCGSQRKWKKCCGKAGAIKPESGSRRLVV